LSEKLTVEIVRDQMKYEENFVNGGHPVGTLKKVGKTKESNGTTVTFKPDPTIFTTTVFNFNTLAVRLRESAFLLKGVKITLTDERAGHEQAEEYLYEEGIKEFVEYLNEDKDTLGNIMYFDGSKHGIEVEIAGQYNDGYSETVLSFVNNVRTKD
ncbi:DNA topoisomerase IV subunit B, partial [Pediococcus acidilactici]|nr:DNA topoisomerase IV subunit B [Pediococcus acidilactici]